MAASNLVQVLGEFLRNSMFALKLAEPRDTEVTTVEIHLLGDAAARQLIIDSRPPLRSDYRLAWKGEIATGPTTRETLERAFAMFQWGGGSIDPPHSYSGRSLAVGDRITLDGGETWQVDVVGFTRAELTADGAQACVDCRIRPADWFGVARCSSCQDRHDELRDDARDDERVDELVV